MFISARVKIRFSVLDNTGENSEIFTLLYFDLKYIFDTLTI